MLRSSVRGRIIAGFVVCLAIMAVATGVSVLGLNEVRTSLNAFSATSTEAVNTAQIPVAMQRVLGATDNYLNTPSDETQKVVQNELAQLSAVAKQLHDASHDEAARTAFNAIIIKAREYDAAITDLRAIDAERAEQAAAYSKLNAAFDNLRRTSGDSARRIGDASLIEQMRKLDEQATGTLLNGERFLVTSDELHHRRTKVGLEGMKRSMERLGNNPLLTTVKSLFLATLPVLDKQIAALDALLAANRQRIEIRTGQLASIATDVSHLSDQVAAKTKSDLNTLTEEARNDAQRTSTVAIVVSIASLGIGIVVAFFLATSISKPIRALTGLMGRLAADETDIELPYQQRGDELGSMSRAVAVFRDNAVARKELEAAGAAETEAQMRRQERVEALIAEFQATAAAALGAVSESMSDMQGMADALTGIARSTEDRATIAAAASEQASTNVQTVAAAAEELSSTIDSINGQVEQTSAVVSRTMTAVAQSQTEVSNLAKAATRISDIIEMIQRIAEQTNLLALNATIEAARAGDAGRGFAVVAAEVKGLANETANATAEITSQIAGIQTATSNAVAAIEDIGRIIEDVNRYAASMMDAVRQQGGATMEISRNVAEVAGGTQQVTREISAVTRDTAETASAAQRLTDLSRAVNENTARLGEAVNTFLTGVLAA